MATQRQQPPQQPPPVMKLRLKYAKRGRARFTSHRDFARAFERSLRRAQVPMALSSGFNQHPRISWVNASPTGAATEADYVEIGLSERREPRWVADAVTAALPDGMVILEAREASGPSLVEALTASAWEVAIDGPDADTVARAVAAALAASELIVERQAKEGLRTFDARPALVSLEAVDARTLRMTLRHGSPLVRPDDVVLALGRVEPGFVLRVPALLTRLAQGSLEGDRLVEPFELSAGGESQ